MALGGTFSGITVETYHKHEDAFFVAYCDELQRASGRVLDNNVLRDAYRVADATLSTLVACYMVGTDVMDARREDGIDFASVEHVLCPQIQEHWNTRCWVINLKERVYAHTTRKHIGLDATRKLAKQQSKLILGRLADFL